MTMTNIFPDEFDALPVGATIREHISGTCPIHGEESEWTDYTKQFDGLWLAVGVSSDEEDFKFAQALGIVEPITSQEFSEEQNPEHSYRWELHESEVAA